MKHHDVVLMESILGLHVELHSLKRANRVIVPPTIVTVQFFTVLQQQIQSQDSMFTQFDKS